MAFRVAVDLSGMVTGDIVYQTTMLNPTLGRWMNLDLGQMPPLYHPSNRVYLLRRAEGSLVAMRFKNFRNQAGVAGFITIEYREVG